MIFKIVENLIRLNEDEEEYVLNIYRDIHNGKTYIFDGNGLIEMPKGTLGPAIRSAEGWGKDEEDDLIDTDGDGNSGDDSGNDDGDGKGEGEEDGDEGDDGNNLTDSNKGGAGDGGDNFYDDMGFDDIDFDLSDEDLFKQMIDSEVKQLRVDKKNRKAQLELEANPNKAVVDVIKKNFKQFISSQIEERIEEVQKRKVNMNAFDDDQTGWFDVEKDIEDYNKPLVQIYLDASGSCSSAATVSVINQCAAAFNSYVKQQLIDVEWYCFGSRVELIEADKIGGASDSAVLAAKNKAGTSTNWGPVKTNIRETKADNVIIVTDSDFSSQHGGETLKIPGAVWCIFVNSVDNNIFSDFRGKVNKKWLINMKVKKGDGETIKV